jgi:hypothetical protein
MDKVIRLKVKRPRPWESADDLALVEADDISWTEHVDIDLSCLVTKPRTCSLDTNAKSRSRPNARAGNSALKGRRYSLPNPAQENIAHAYVTS